jgi:UDP-2,3-diacylglucosamine hydrolase
VSRALFVSDIHISSSSDPKYALFLSFLDDCLNTKPQFLFLVGDIFDLWIADRAYFVARYSEAAARLKALVAAGVAVHYFEGNHDLDLEVYWRYVVGLEVHEQAAYFDLDGRVLRVEHGDQMDPEDRGYLFLRWFLRTPVLRFLGRHLPNSLVAWIGERASRTSRDYTSNVKTTSDERSRRKMREHGERVWIERHFDYLVSGHTHVREEARLRGGAEIFNLGTWLKEPVVLEWQGDRFSWSTLTASALSITSDRSQERSKSLRVEET